MTKKSGILVGAMTFTENIFDGAKLEPQLCQEEKLIESSHKLGVVYRVYQGRKEVRGVKIVIPKKLPK